jgi:uncharacterized protein with PIN domain
MEFTVTQVPASESGALDRWESRCPECGIVLRSSVRELLNEDIHRHTKWHESSGSARTRS